MEVDSFEWNDRVRAMLRDARLQSGLSARQLGLEVDMNSRTIRRIESGETEVRAKTIDKWLEACGFYIQMELLSRW